MTKAEGWGVKQDIPRGAFVIECVEEVCSDDEIQNNRSEFYNAGMSHLYSLGYEEHEKPDAIDATLYGNIFRFVNHSCEPNVRKYNVYVEKVDVKTPRLAFIAIKRLKKSAELTLDYGLKNHGKGDQRKPTKCECGAVKWRKFL